MEVTWFARGDLVRVKHRGKVLRGFWVFMEVKDGLVTVRQIGAASPRYFEANKVEMIDHDARWPS